MPVSRCVCAWCRVISNHAVGWRQSKAVEHLRVAAGMQHHCRTFVIACHDQRPATSVALACHSVCATCRRCRWASFLPWSTAQSTPGMWHTQRPTRRHTSRAAQASPRPGCGLMLVACWFQASKHRAELSKHLEGRCQQAPCSNTPLAQLSSPAAWLWQLQACFSGVGML